MIPLPSSHLPLRLCGKIAFWETLRRIEHAAATLRPSWRNDFGGSGAIPRQFGTKPNEVRILSRRQFPSRKRAETQALS